MDGDGSSIIWQILFLIILVFINAFFASSEIAIISLNDNKIKKMAEEGNKKAKFLERLTNEPSKFLATIQVGVTLSGLLASATASQSFADRLTNIIKSTGIPVAGTLIKSISVILITILLSYFTLVFGELVPKRIAMNNPEGISMLSIKPLKFIFIITRPFVNFLSFSTNSIISIFGIDPEANEETVTEEEIRMMVDAGQESGVIESTEGEMIDNIFEFDDTNVSEIMTHRTDIVAIPIDCSYEEIMDIAINEKYTRIPVYEESIDNITGILHIKDLLSYSGIDSRSTFSLKEIIRQPYFVPISKKTDELFKDMQRNKVHMAVVIDEYGGTAGIVTIEDLLEEIVGNIFDEYDEEEKEIEKIDENTYIMDGAISLDDVSDLLKIELPVEDYETLSGFIVGQLGRIPDEDEKPVVEFGNLVFKVENVDDKRIERTKVYKMP